MADKLPFKLTIKLEGYRPEAVHAALTHLDHLCGEEVLVCSNNLGPYKGW